MLEIRAASVVGSREALFGTSPGEVDRSGTTTAVRDRPMILRGQQD
jgi:hypothetical protein